MIEVCTSDLLRQASVIASVLVKSGAFSRDDWDDLRQELILDCINRIRRFDPARGTQQGFLFGVMRNHATVLLRRRCRRRKWEIALETLLDQSNSYAQLPNDRDVPAPSTSAEFLRMEAHLDVQKIIAMLPIGSRTLARQLRELSVTEICRQTGKSRSGVYAKLRDIRGAFLAVGLGPHERREKRGKSSPR